MTEVLSQSEIDALLNSLATEEVEPEMAIVESARKVKDYDFKSPKKFSKEQTKVLMGVFESFSRHLSSYFSGILRAYCEVSIDAIEELPYYEYNNALPDSILIGVLEMKPIEGDVLVDISNSITFSLIERLLGGNGDGETPDRDFTEIEISLMRRIFKQIAVSLKDAWFSLLEIESSLKEIETNARLMQAMPMDEAVVVIVIDVMIESVQGTINFCLPCLNLESIIDQLSQSRFKSKRSSDGEHEEVIKNAMITHIKEAPLEAVAVFGETVLTLNDILNLQVGDVIKFDLAVGTDIKINIADQTWCYGVPGIKRKKKVIKVSKVI